ncbi:hypothetical protein OG352_23795 [Streptomyces sp. NBC_01485]|nr:hypothetical protein [Streptomyces sp. NBC_01485]
MTRKRCGRAATGKANPKPDAEPAVEGPVHPFDVLRRPRGFSVEM